MSTDPIPQVHALAAAVRDGELTPEQREHLVTLLHAIDTAAALAPTAEQRYPGDGLRAAVYQAVVWEPVGTGYRRLLDQLASVAVE